MGVVQDIIGGSILDGAAKMISLFKVPPEVALQHQAELERIAADQKKAILDAANRDVEAASANIRAEMATGDKFTTRARPMFLYVIEIVIFYNYVFSPLLHRAQHLELPTELLYLFGSGFLGYTGARTWEKFSGLGGIQVTKLNGGQNVQEKE